MGGFAYRKVVKGNSQFGYSSISFQIDVSSLIDFFHVAIRLSLVVLCE